MTDEMASFLDPGLDYANEDMTDDEVARYLDWCRRVHGEGNLDLVPFAQFFAEFDRRGLKRLRRYTGTLALPPAAAVLMWSHTYAVSGFAKGVIYEAIAARELGVSREEFLDILRIAGTIGGPPALNAAGELTLDYLRAWPDGESAAAWPEGWIIDPHGLEAGIDHTTDDLLEGELEAIADWHRKVHGSLPASFEKVATANVRAFKTSRIRFERMAGHHTPVQLVPLLALHAAVALGQGPERIRAAAELATHLGIGQAVIDDVLYWGAAIGGYQVMVEAFEALGVGGSR